jgi:8-oxo-dGTP pyrophosphatase MutT (NUDIX family)
VNVTDKDSSEQGNAKAKPPTVDQVSAGGVAFRPGQPEPEVIIISVRPSGRWQLPKGIIDKGETPEAAALREVREEAGVETAMVAKLDMVEYWYVGKKREQQVRYHKFVHFFLLSYLSGEVAGHDHEVEEARWVNISEAVKLLAFKSERDVVEKAREMISSRTDHQRLLPAHETHREFSVSE